MSVAILQFCFYHLLYFAVNKIIYRYEINNDNFYYCDINRLQQ